MSSPRLSRSSIPASTVTTRVRLCLLLLVVTVDGLTAAQHAPGSPSAAAEYSREAYVVERYHTAWRFEADGSGRRKVSVRVKVQSETGVQLWGQLLLACGAASERMDVGPVRVHDERLRPLADALRIVKYRALFPDETPAKILRRGTLSCSSSSQPPSCQFVLMPPLAAQFAQQQ
jgi:hypothetical protein